MKWTNPLALTAGLTLAASSTLAVSSSEHVKRLSRPAHLDRRQDQPVATEEQQVAIYNQAFSDPVGAARAAVGLPYIAGQAATGNLYQYNIINDNQQLPWNEGIYFQPEAQVGGSVDEGWQALPEIPDFTLNRTTVIRDGAIMPFYMSANRDPAKIKRAVMVMPGKPRDSWKYTMLVQNALSVAATNASSGVTNDSVLIIGPCWLNTDDRRAGALQDNELVWYGSQWQRGGESRGPGNTAISTYEVLDYLLDQLFDKAQYPALNRVVIAGHSMGAQMAQRYAMVKEERAYDPNVHYWIGNPGSYVWPTDDRPIENATCTTGDDWPYGLGDTTVAPEFVKEELNSDKAGVVERYRNRNVHINLGLLDNGAGDTSCDAGLQGANHLERGGRHVEALAGMAGGYPERHTVNLMPRVSHLDYAMLSYNISLWRLFADGLNEAEATNAISTGSGSNRGSNNGALAVGGSAPLALGAMLGAVALGVAAVL